MAIAFNKTLASPTFLKGLGNLTVSTSASSLSITISISGYDEEVSFDLATYKKTKAIIASNRAGVIRLEEILSGIIETPHFLEGLGTLDPITPYSVTITAKESDDSEATQTVIVFPGGVKGKSVSDLFGNWLTWRPQVAVTYPWAKEYLSMLLGTDLSPSNLAYTIARWAVQVTGHYEDGSIAIASLEAVSIDDIDYTSARILVDVSYSTVYEALGVAGTLSYYDICLIGQSEETPTGGSGSVYITRYTGIPMRLKVGQSTGRMKEFLFINSMGSDDRVFTEGDTETQLEGEITSFTSDYIEEQLDNTLKEKWEVHSGLITSKREAALWLDFLKSRRLAVYDPDTETTTAIIIDSWSTDLKEKKAGTVSFTYHLAQEPDGRWFDNSASLEDVGDFGSDFGSDFC